jgi:methyl-accepting chemotaxis protein
MTVESNELENLRETTSKTLLAVLWLHVPVSVAISIARGADWLLPAALMVALALPATLSWRAK